MFQLRFTTPTTWTEPVLADFDRFLQDHAAAEKKASGMAVSMFSHYPDKPLLVESMVNLALEEMNHFRQVVKIMHERGIYQAPDEKDPYINNLRKLIRRGPEHYLLDRLLTGGIIEARGCERFGLVADALPSGQLKTFYRTITESEARHHELFVELALQYFPRSEVDSRLDQLLDAEAEITAALPHRAALH
ncbi:tRNA-(ms[2]io[6]A)-hydroxylase [Microbulbifer thermotolerans]|uniref:tRNA-(Ms[2]io[6]A)-hydroxylase n=1 Tax=Microbulbifer thermotolerans TaxID=252514 RepID=A0AB35HV68_MICTH|nr:tRNA-(ms[2]io[6]A)-hydroxylase [Microbulbifer thermotolerans]MCX2780893.1 tRNA-(ms[2]io[6]A)-hydroxylase [Microbulbifer thermotolerans]MCX2784253.1 tRNA-(ms[2]io[6]A)-hydroxylase [Microbulbifer thermotolerans]MCX2794330.1 tRNA-(ms[2]io[6]A)-hydroxylase [Microbulbifer thermotolerans]MCX2800978.1 tRNA-(ms[2]io[6]A)-hydroxylase [Microbulbifer thermotolerans]MCX2804858.1 tRNA-(ms[2]io[6]A)-hydroxylase [Microbulbifer thermotolerans]